MILDDETVMAVSSAASLAFGLHCFLAPSHALDFYMAPGTPYIEPQGRWIGFGLGLAGIQGLVVTYSSGSQPAKRNLLKSMAAAWLVSAGLHTYYASTGEMRRETCYATAVLSAA